MAKRIATINIHFNEDVDMDEACDLIFPLLNSGRVDVSGTVLATMEDETGSMTVRRQKVVSDFLREYDDEYGGPVWYIP